MALLLFTRSLDPTPRSRARRGAAWRVRCTPPKSNRSSEAAAGPHAPSASGAKPYPVQRRFGRFDNPMLGADTDGLEIVRVAAGAIV